MRRPLLLLLAFSPSSVCAQQEFSVESPPPPPHLEVLRARDNLGLIPIHVATLMILRSAYESERAGRRSAADRFALRYDTNPILANDMVAAIRQVASDVDAHTMAQRRAFCARSFSSEGSWRAALIEFNADKSAVVAGFNRLRDVAGTALWERIVLDAHEATKQMTVVDVNYDSATAELGWESIFARQCIDQ